MNKEYLKEVNIYSFNNENYVSLQDYTKLQQRIDKAIGYMKSIEMDKTDKYIPIRDYDEYQYLLSILQGKEVK